MRILGLILGAFGLIACLLAILNSVSYAEEVGLRAIAFSIAAIGIVGLAAAVLNISK